MGVATTTNPPLLSSSDHHHHHHHHNHYNSMSQQDYHHQGIFSFSNAFERSQPEQQQQQHIAQQIRRDKLRVQGFEPPPPLITIDEVEPSGIPGYETAGMLSEMFNFTSNPGGGPAAADIGSTLDNQLVTQHSFLGNTRGQQQQPPPPTTPVGSEWYGNRQGIMLAAGAGLGSLAESKDPNVVVNERDSIPTHPHHHHHHHHQHQQQHQQQQQISGINADSAAAMQLFLMNPQPRSPSPPQSHPPPPTSSTLHMLLPNPPSSTSTLHHHHHQGVNFLHHQVNPTSPAGGHFGPSQFTWVADHSPSAGGAHGELSPNEIGGGVVEGQGLSLSLSSSLQHLEAAKAEELRMGDGAMLFFNQPGGSNATTTSAAAAAAAQYPYKSLSGIGQNHQVHIGFGSSLGMVNVLRSSKYAKAAQELLEEFCSVGRGHLKKNKLARNNSNPNSNPSGSGGGGATSGGGGGANSASSSKDLPPLSAADRLEHQRRKVKLLSMLDEVDRRYNHYCEQMQMVVNSFDLVMGFGAAVPYTALAQKAMSRHFRCLKDAIAAQLKSSCELLGEKDAGTSGVTKGETPRLKLLEQSLRQQRAFHQMGMMEQEAWRPQRGLPERSVNILRAWLFEHFLHPYPSDADKHLLARQTGLSRNQVSNWFINARVRLWKPMVEEMYQQEAKDEPEQGTETSPPSNSNNDAQTPMPTPTPTTTTAPPPPATTASASPSTTTFTPTGKRSEINDTENDPSFFAINTQCFSENQAKLQHHPNTNHRSSSTTSTPSMSIPHPLSATTTPPPISSSQSFPTGAYVDQSDACRRSTGIVTSGNAEIAGSTLIRFGTSAGDVSLTLGLRHAGNLPENKSTFSVRDFGGC